MRRFVHLARRRLGETLADQRGVALVLTLLVVVLLTAMILDFDYQTRLDVRAAANFRDDTRAYLLAGSAVEAARVILQQDQHPDYDGLDEVWATPIKDYPVADGTISVAVTDASGKLNLNTLLDANNQPDEARIAVYKRLLQEVVDPDQTDVDELVDTVIDWIDPDPDSRPRGAEGDYYLGLDPPYACRDGKLRGFDELGLVKGYTPAVMKRIAPFVTAIWFGDATNRAAGNLRQDRININTAPKEVLMALDPEIDEGLAERIMDDRLGTPFTHADPSTLETTIGLLNDPAQRIAPLLSWRSDLYSVEATAQVGDTRRTVHTLIRRGAGVQGPRRTQVLAWRVE
jgi:general secretion pathway protein K